MNQQMKLFEGHHEIMILTKHDVNFGFKGDFLIRAKDVAGALEYLGKTETSNVLKFCKSDQVFTVHNSNLLNQEVRKLHNTGELFLTKSIDLDIFLIDSISSLSYKVSLFKAKFDW